MELRGTGGLRLRRVDDRGQLLVFDHDPLGRVAGLVLGLGDHHGDDIADIADDARRDRRMGAGVHRRAVLGMDHPAADQAADLVGGEIGAGQDRDHAGGAGRLGGADRVDAGMSVGRADEDRVGGVPDAHVVGIPALAGQKALVLLAENPGADAVVSHGAFPSL